MRNGSEKILLIGKNGQVGWEVHRLLGSLGELVAMDWPDIDLCEAGSIRRIVRECRPDIIVNAAAFTAVDEAESKEAIAAEVNANAPGILAEEAKRLGALLVHYSTDYVFDGTKPTAYVEGDTPNPLNVYGRTKLGGERAVVASGARHMIFRTSWVYGVRGGNFLRTILRLARERAELRIVDDQAGAPTWSRRVAQGSAYAIAQLLSAQDWRMEASRLSGIYHLTAGDRTTWWGFASAIVSEAAANGVGGLAECRIVPIPTSELPRPAPRPKNSVLSNEKLLQMFGLLQPDWREDLRLVIDDLVQHATVAADSYCPTSGVSRN